jgi:Zn-dependent protease with chaperone function
VPVETEPASATGAPASGEGTGLLYGPGLAPGGVTVAVQAAAEGLQLPGIRSAAPVAWSALEVRASDYGAGTLTLQWTEGGATLALVVSDAATRAALAPFLPAARRAAPAAGRGTRRLSATLIAALVVLPLLVVGALLVFSGQVVDWVVARIPVETEIALGKAAAAQQKAALQLVEDHPALPAIREIGARLTRGSPYPYEFHVARDASVNAFAMPGGFVVLHTGLLEQAERAEEVAGVLAHEVQHVERRHGLRGLVQAAGLGMALQLALGEAGGSVAAAWARDLARLSFSREQERDADARGVEALVRAGIDPRGMAVFFRKLAAQGGAVPALLSSHPASEERFAAVEAKVPAGTQFAPLDVDWKAVRR